MLYSYRVVANKGSSPSNNLQRDSCMTKRLRAFCLFKVWTEYWLERFSGNQARLHVNGFDSARNPKKASFVTEPTVPKSPIRKQFLFTAVANNLLSKCP